MAHNPHAPQGPDPSQDPAGNTQMFRAFVDEEAPGPRAGAGPQRRAAPQAAPSGPRVGVILAVVVLIAVVAAAAWLALS